MDSHINIPQMQKFTALFIGYLQLYALEVGEKMKARRLVVLCIICMLLVGCSKQTCIDYIRQPKENIEKIELIFNQGTEGSMVLFTLSGEQIAEFIGKLSVLSIGKHREPHGSLGYLVIGLYFKDGETQLIGTQSSAYRSSDKESELQFDNWHYVAYSEMYELFTQYVGEEKLSLTK